METREIQTRGPLNAVVVPPGSKSITNRALLLAALCNGKTVLEGALDCEDTQVMFSALKQLGLDVTQDAEKVRMTVNGQGGHFPNNNIDFHVGNSGTTARFLAAALCFTEGNYRMHGKPRMHERPIVDLVDALRQLGADIRCENNDGCPPLIIYPGRTYPTPLRAVDRSGDIPKMTRCPWTTTVSGSVSSQFLSALLMAAPLASKEQDVEIRVSGALVSKPYIVMTLDMMRSFGAEMEISDVFSSFVFPAGTKYRSPGTYRIEPDASAASYFFAAAAVCGGSVRVPGLSKNSLQGDVHFADCLEKMGCAVRYENEAITVSRDPDASLRGISVDMNTISDTAQTLAAVALFAEGPTEISNIEHVRFKETDRIADLARELRRFGASVEERQDGLRIVPPKKLSPATVETYDDHRMAMSFAVVGLRLPGVVIRDPNCVRKTFPRFFEVLESLR